MKKLQAIREELGLTMEAAAERAGFSGRQQWYMIESGRRADVAVSTLEKIAKSLGVKPGDLLK